MCNNEMVQSQMGNGSRVCLALFTSVACRDSTSALLGNTLYAHLILHMTSHGEMPRKDA